MSEHMREAGNVDAAAQFATALFLGGIRALPGKTL